MNVVFTWTVGHTVEMAVSQNEVLSSTFGFEPSYNVSDLIVAACESAQEVDAKRAAVFVRLHSDGVGTVAALPSYPLHLLHQEVYGHDLILRTACGSRPHTGDTLQVLPFTHKRHAHAKANMTEGKNKTSEMLWFVCHHYNDTSFFIVQSTDAGTLHSFSSLTAFTSYRRVHFAYTAKDKGQNVLFL